MKNLIIVMILHLFLTINSKAQLLEDLQGAKSFFKTELKDNYSELAKGNNNEIESTFSVIFVFYKKFISSQDIDACVFHPSCSVYAIECLHHEKVKLIAFLKISDRITRCHPLISQGTYRIHKPTSKFFDPIEN